MSNGFLQRVYELASDYIIRLEVGYVTTRLQITSVRKRITKTSIFRMSELSQAENLDECCLAELEELLDVVQKEEDM